MATTMIANDLQEVHNGLGRGYTIVDHTTYTDGRPGYRTINVTDGDGQYLGHIAEYPTATPRFVFTPRWSVPYGCLAELVESLKFLGVHVEEPVRDEEAA